MTSHNLNMTVKWEAAKAASPYPCVERQLLFCSHHKLKFLNVAKWPTAAIQSGQYWQFLPILEKVKLAMFYLRHIGVNPSCLELKR
jgi:hypothetical protein